jgi:hypothetical protein
MQNHSTRLRNRADSAGTRESFTPEMAEFYDSLFEYQWQQYEHYSSAGMLPSFQAKELPLSENASPEFLERSLLIVVPGLGPLLELMARYYPKMNFEPLAGALRGGALPEFAGAFLHRDAARLERLAGAHKTDRDQGIFLITNLLKPFFVALREANEKRAIPQDESHRLCPFCGYYPDMAAILGERDGKRFLQCSLCENRWAYPRIACVVCGTEDARNLEYLSPDEGSRYRIDVCHACSGYIKTVRLDKFEDFDECNLAVENVLTADLDGVALQAGYKRP